MTKRRNKVAEARARETKAAQRRAEERRISPAAYRRRRIGGWTLVALGVGMALQHLVHHFGAFTLISNGWDDFVAGYPLAALLGVIGSVVLSAPARKSSRR